MIAAPVKVLGVCMNPEYSFYDKRRWFEAGYYNVGPLDLPNQSTCFDTFYHVWIKHDTDKSEIFHLDIKTEVGL